MPLATYAAPPDESHWSRLWQRHELDALLRVAQLDPLSDHLQAHLPRHGRVLEGGCGLGQYVLYFRRQGYHVVGGDFSLPALQAHRRQEPASPLAALDLLALPFADHSFAAHISLGVVEHLPGGPQPILREMVRTLRPGGLVLLSVPWLNGLRALFRPLLARRQRRKQADGLAFYQYYYRRGEIRAFLRPSGLRVVHFYPYSPGRGLRQFLPRRRPLAAARPQRSPKTSEVSTQPRGRRLLYWPPILALTAHMILAVAVKEENDGHDAP